MPASAGPELPFLPEARPDELLYSRVVRFHELIGGGPAKDTLARLFDNGFAICSSGLPNRIGALTAYFNNAESSDDILEQNTLLPYYRPFLNPVQVRVLRQNMMLSDARGMKSVVGLLASRLGAFNALRLCLHCMRADEREFGVAYWHRSHQAPGVLVCPIHGDPLLDASIMVSLSRHSLVLPRAAQGIANCTAGNFSEEVLAGLRELAAATSYVLDANLPNLGPARVRTVLLEQATSLGLVTGNGRVRQREFLRLFSARWKCLQDSSDPSLATVLGSTTWAESLLRKPRGSKHPLRHLLVALTLFPSAEAFLSACVNGDIAGSTCAEGATVPGTAQKGRERNRLAEEATKLVTQDGLSLRAAAANLGLDTTTVRLYVQSCNAEVQRRRKSIDEGLEKRISARLINGEAIADIARSLDVSYSSVWRVLACDPTLRASREDRIKSRQRNRFRVAWSEALKLRASNGLNAARKAQPAPYAWLYRNDRDWLIARNAEVQRKRAQRESRSADWSGRDVEFVMRLERAAEELAGRAGPPYRASSTRLARHAGISSFVDKKLSLLPRTRETLDRLSESVEAFQLRRMEYARQDFLAAGVEPAPWRINRAAGLRGKARLISTP